MENNIVEVFSSLFDGNKRSFGRFTTGAKTVKAEPTPEDWARHLNGEVGIGIVAVKDDATCSFGAIDIDCHKEGQEPPDLDLLEEAVIRYSLPVNVCRSKSGGAHLYIFFDKPVRAALAVRKLKEYAKLLGFADAEIFPKQTQLKSGHLGNWINLPYFGSATNRYCVRDGKALSLLEFLEKKRVADFSAFSPESMIDLADAPPCVCTLIRSGIEKGNRNEALYACGVYFKRRYPEDWRTMIALVNDYSDDPLPEHEMKGILGSLGRKDYVYRCNNDPCASLCDKEECDTKKFGIKNTISKPTVPITKLVRFNTEPSTWQLTVDGNGVTFADIADLMSYKKVRLKIADQLKILLPNMKNDAWEMHLEPLLKDCEDDQTPDNASASGSFVQRLIEFIRRSGCLSDEINDQLVGGCKVATITGTKHVIFSYYEFTEFLRRSRVQVPSNLWVHLREAGVKRHIGDLCIIVAADGLALDMPEAIATEY